MKGFNVKIKDEGAYGFLLNNPQALRALIAASSLEGTRVQVESFRDDDGVEKIRIRILAVRLDLKENKRLEAVRDEIRGVLPDALKDLVNVTFEPLSYLRGDEGLN